MKKKEERKGIGEIKAFVYFCINMYKGGSISIQQ